MNPLNPLYFIRHNWKEILLSFIAIYFFIDCTRLIRAIDPSAGVFDLGFLHAPVFAGVVLILAFLAVWIIQAIFAPTISRYFDVRKFVEDWNSARPEFRIASALGFVLFLVACFCAITASVL